MNAKKNEPQRGATRVASRFYGWWKDITIGKRAFGYATDLRVYSVPKGTPVNISYSITSHAVAGYPYPMPLALVLQTKN